MITVFERQRIFAILIALVFMGLVIELVRRRKLREEYAWLWLIVGTVIIALAISQNLLVFVTRLVGAIIPTSTAFFLGLVFLLLLSVHYSVKISHLVDQIKNLAQNLAILQAEIDELVRNDKPGSAQDTILKESDIAPSANNDASERPPSASGGRGQPS